MTLYHLAQVNIATAKYDLSDARMADFMDALDHINALAESAPGFVWRFIAGNGNATSLRAFENDRTIYNASVWTGISALQDYAFHSQHTSYLRRRGEWFEKSKNYSAIWWVPAGHQPTVEESKQALVALANFGPTPRAFTFSKLFSPPDTRLNVGSGTIFEDQIGYCRAVRLGNSIEVAGTTAVDVSGAVIGANDPAEQTRFVLKKIERALIQAGASLADVVRTRMFVTDISHWRIIGDVHGEFFRDIKPVATMVEVSRLIDPALLVEIEVSALISDSP